MEIELEISSNWNGDESHYLTIDGKHAETISSLSESPEDAIIGRSLVSGYDIIKYMMLAHEAGKKGEELNITYKEEDDNKI